uniref:RanBP2-type domain-containing protein n=1 Tax=Haemonchus contortus TaxID=6289 RepID=A0A7I4Y0N7_HAECO|nr:unnamed protein product [Haemonchus contortus]
MDSDASEPSTSSASFTKDSNRSKLDRLVKKVGRKLLPKAEDHIFVPSALSSPSSSRMSYSPSTDDSRHSPYDEVDCRKNSAPASVVTPLPSLFINTFGDEAAGSGYGWLTDPDAPEPYHGVESVIRAQQVGLDMVKDRIRLTKQEIDTCRQDQQMIADFVADTFRDELNANRDESKIRELVEDVERLQKEVDELRKLSPRSVPPPRPAPPHQHLIWHCIRCLEGNNMTSFRCKCSFPRVAIDPREAAKCKCTHCSKATAGRSSAPPTIADGD